jgi:aminoglycoside phosphotransferase family enzyme/predicted kinase
VEPFKFDKSDGGELTKMPRRSDCSKPFQNAARADDQERLIAALMDGRRYPIPSKNVRLMETHISWVLLAGSYAYKIKKAIDLGFLNFISLESRHFYCEEEVRLNRRLAPELYLDVVPIGGALGTPEFGVLPAMEYAVRMRRFPESNELDKLAARGKLMPRHIDHLAATLAAFHQSLPSVEAGSDLGSPQVIHSTVFQVFDRLASLLKGNQDAEKVVLLKRAVKREYGVNEAYFAERRARGFVRECHGDLHLGNIALINDRPVPFDCIEFDPALRWIDVMNEIAFTVMDLLHYQMPPLAYRLLNAYLEDTGDYDGVRLLPFYLAHRATVRAMVSAIRCRQPGLDDWAKQEAVADYRDLITLADERLSHHEPVLIITHGLPGSGKTTFAQTALEKLQLIRVRSDVERKRLFGLSKLSDSNAHPEGIYRADATSLTYRRLHELSENLLRSGARVIVDAAFLQQDERESFRRLADKMKIPFALASLRASPATLHTRIVQRRESGNDASEADLSVLEKLRSHQQALTPEERVGAVEFSNEGNGFSDDAAGWQRLGDLITKPHQAV